MPARRLGIIGGGQLGLMLAEAATKYLGHEISHVSCFVEPELDLKKLPIRLCPSVEVVQDLKAFLRNTDLQIFENEFIELRIWNSVKGFNPFPLSEAMAFCQNKRVQKENLRSMGLPTAPFESIDEDNFEEVFSRCFEAWEGVVLKCGTMGYDGNGNFAVPPHSSPDLVVLKKWVAKNLHRSLYLEAFIDFDWECSMLSGHRKSTTGNWDHYHYPLVKTEQTQNICQWVWSLEDSRKPNLESQANNMVNQIAESFSLEGVFAAEMFLTKQGELLINELAPRVHNSGHWTLAKGCVSQFDLHIRLALGLEVPTPLNRRDYFYMRNLLGISERALDEKSSPPWLSDEISVKWYGKVESRPKRKLGHLYGSFENEKDLHRAIEKVKERLPRWEKENF